MRGAAIALLLLVGCQQTPHLSPAAKVFLQDLEESRRDPKSTKHLIIEYASSDLSLKLKSDSSFTLLVRQQSRNGVMSQERRDALLALLLRPQLYEDAGPRLTGRETLALRDDIYDRNLVIGLDHDGELAVMFRNVIDEVLKNSTEPIPAGYHGP